MTTYINVFADIFSFTKYFSKKNAFVSKMNPLNTGKLWEVQIIRKF